MIYFTIEGKQYQAVTEWTEITLKQCICLYKVCLEFPLALRDYYLAFVPQKEDTHETIESRTSRLYNTFTTEQLMKEFPEHYGKAIQAISDCPESVIQHILPADRIVLHQQYLFPLAFGLLTGLANYTPRGITEFEFQGITYQMPKSRQVLGQEQPMAHEIALVFTEAADLLVASNGLSEGKWDRAANIVAILCRPEGEEYKEDVALERAQQFIDLPMSIILEVFFCCLTPLLISRQQEVICFLKNEAEKRKAMNL